MCRNLRAMQWHHRTNRPSSVLVLVHGFCLNQSGQPCMVPSCSTIKWGLPLSPIPPASNVASGSSRHRSGLPVNQIDLLSAKRRPNSSIHQNTFAIFVLGTIYAYILYIIPYINLMFRADPNPPCRPMTLICRRNRLIRPYTSIFRSFLTNQERWFIFIHMKSNFSQSEWFPPQRLCFMIHGFVCVVTTFGSVPCWP